MRLFIIAVPLYLFFLVGIVSTTEPFQEIPVYSGETLRSVAEKYFKNPERWPEILKYNKLTNNDPSVSLSSATVKLKIPVMLLKEEFRPSVLLRVSGKVSIQLQGTKKLKKAREGTRVNLGDIVRITKKSSALMKLYSGEIVNLNEKGEYNFCGKQVVIKK